MRQVNGIILAELHPLLPKQRLLNLVTVIWLQGYAPLPIGHPVSGESLLPGGRVQHPHHLAGTARIAGIRRNSTVGGDFSLGYTSDHGFYSPAERRALRFPFPLILHALAQSARGSSNKKIMLALSM